MQPPASVGETLWRIQLDRSRCTRSGLCVGTAPEHFSVEASGETRPLSEFVPSDPAVLDAAYCCPTEAITVREAAGGRQLAPDDENDAPARH